MAEQNSGSNLVKIHSDEPAIKEVHFGFEAYADTLAGMIANKYNETPLVIGIYGSWGSGKTTLMKAIQERIDGEKKAQLANNLKAQPGELRQCKTVWFQAWKYDKESEILAGLIETIFDSMAKEGFFSVAKAKAEIEKIAKRLNKEKILGFISNLFTGVDVSEFFSELEYKKETGFYDVFRKFFNDLILIYLDWRARLKQNKQPDDNKGAMVIFIDDLDRCPKPRIVKVLETIKLFMDHKGCVFVIGAAHDIIVKALRDDYDESDALRFMEKIVQVRFSLPKVTKEMFQPYLEGLRQTQEEITDNLHLIMPAMANNPRQMKRFINNLNLRHGLMRRSGIALSYDTVLRWGIIEHAFQDAAKDFSENSGNLFVLKGKIPDIINKLGHDRVWEADRQLLGELTVPDSLHEYILYKPLARVLASLEVEREAFEELLTFAASTKAEVVTEPAPERQDKGRRTENMVEVPAGSFKFGEGLEEAQIKEPYGIDIYLVTYARFRQFIRDGGYETEQWWEEVGWEWREDNKILRPERWVRSDYSRDEQPVVGVSWYEAKAFCSWLTKKSRDGFAYDLPSEKQWERAARGTNGREYPWGNEYNKERCNTRESGIGRTTRVDRYANGVSLVGCYDMAGNVWEWTTDFYDGDEDTLVIKGGSWYDSDIDSRCASRGYSYPVARDSDVGFRCARTSK